jgi:hypothetical protein
VLFIRCSDNLFAPPLSTPKNHQLNSVQLNQVHQNFSMASACCGCIISNKGMGGSEAADQSLVIETSEHCIYQVTITIE